MTTATPKLSKKTEPLTSPLIYTLTASSSVVTKTGSPWTMFLLYALSTKAREEQRRAVLDEVVLGSGQSSRLLRRLTLSLGTSRSRSDASEEIQELG